MVNHLSDWVDPYIGSVGHLLTATQPLVHLPHAMVQIRPVLDEKIRDFYLAPTIYGFPLGKGLLMPDIGDEPSFRSVYDHDFEEVHCYSGRVLLEDSGIVAGYTVTEHCAVYRFAFPEKGNARLKIALHGCGSLRYENGAVMGEEKFLDVPHCFAAVFSQRPIGSEESCGALIFSFEPGCELTVKAGFSYIDTEQAMENLDREARTLSFEETAARARKICQ